MNNTKTTKKNDNTEKQLEKKTDEKYKKVSLADIFYLATGEEIEDYI